MLDVYHEENGVIVILGKHLVDLDIVALERRPCRVPAQELLFLADLWSGREYFLHHAEHGLVVEVVEEPDIGLTGILLEGDSIAVDDVEGVIVDFAQEGPHDALAPLLEVDSVEVVDDGKEDEGVDVDLSNLCFAHLKII